MMVWKKTFKRLLVVGGALLVIVIFVCNQYVLSFGGGIVSDVSKVLPRPVALIFGGGMKNAAEMSTMQTDRVRRGVELYKAGKVKKLLMTGDDGGMNADEVDAMRDFAVKQGVKASDVLIDGQGYRTLESCRRARTLLGIDDAIVVSQSFHLPRIVYLCRAYGMTVLPVSADLDTYPLGYTNTLREWLSRVKAVTEVEVLKKLQ